ncbi:MAG: hypothetical protein IJX71_01860 [Oscillospiraceae bacterium]|nr:hypothetical protein [Oscillospiraceae bacterium]
MKQLCERKRCRSQWRQRIKQLYLCLVTGILLLTVPGGLVTQVPAFTAEGISAMEEPSPGQEHFRQRRDLFFAVPIQERNDWKSWRNIWRENEMRQ